MKRHFVPPSGVVILALLASTAVMASGQHHVAPAQYMRAVPAGSGGLPPCRRVCAKSKSEGKKAAPICVKWTSVC
jgi:hypothetical protein